MEKFTAWAIMLALCVLVWMIVIWFGIYLFG